MVRRLTTPRKQQLAQKLRAEPSEAERALWQLLRRRQVGGFRFRRRAVVLGWIPDFWCPAAKLAIEIDGRATDGKRRRDEHRDAELAKLGIRTLHVAVQDVFDRPASVAAQISAELRAPRESAACSPRDS